jgi:hypothetical protein
MMRLYLATLLASVADSAPLCAPAQGFPGRDGNCELLLPPLLPLLLLLLLLATGLLLAGLLLLTRTRCGCC